MISHAWAQSLDANKQVISHLDMTRQDISGISESLDANEQVISHM